MECKNMLTIYPIETELTSDSNNKTSTIFVLLKRGDCETKKFHCQNQTYRNRKCVGAAHVPDYLELGFLREGFIWQPPLIHKVNLGSNKVDLLFTSG